MWRKEKHWNGIYCILCDSNFWFPWLDWDSFITFRWLHHFWYYNEAPKCISAWITLLDFRFGRHSNEILRRILSNDTIFHAIIFMTREIKRRFDACLQKAITTHFYYAIVLVNLDQFKIISTIIFPLTQLIFFLLELSLYSVNTVYFIYIGFITWITKWKNQ